MYLTKKFTSNQIVRIVLILLYLLNLCKCNLKKEQEKLLCELKIWAHHLLISIIQDRGLTLLPLKCTQNELKKSIATNNSIAILIASSIFLW